MNDNITRVDHKLLSIIKNLVDNYRRNDLGTEHEKQGVFLSTKTAKNVDQLVAYVKENY